MSPYSISIQARSFPDILRIITRYSTKHICPSSLRIIYCNDKKPRSSILIDTLFEGISAFVDGLSNEVLYLKKKINNK